MVITGYNMNRQRKLIQCPTKKKTVAEPPLFLLGGCAAARWLLSHYLVLVHICVRRELRPQVCRVRV